MVEPPFVSATELVNMLGDLTRLFQFQSEHLKVR